MFTLLQMIDVPVTAPTWQLTVVYNQISRGSKTLFYFPGLMYTSVTYKPEQTHTYTIFKNLKS